MVQPATAESHSGPTMHGSVPEGAAARLDAMGRLPDQVAISMRVSGSSLISLRHAGPCGAQNSTSPNSSAAGLFVWCDPL